MSNPKYNFRLNTSNTEESDQDYELQHQKLRLAWANITSLFLTKGKSLKFRYWSEDIKNENSGYPNSGYGIKKISTSDDHIFYEKDTEDILILHAPLNDTIESLFFKSTKEDHITISPFFHFDILCENGLSIYTSQDFGENVLMFLNNEDLAKLAGLIDKFLLIPLPEDITHHFY